MTIFEKKNPADDIPTLGIILPFGFLPGSGLGTQLQQQAYKNKHTFCIGDTLVERGSRNATDRHFGPDGMNVLSSSAA